MSLGHDQDHLSVAVEARPSGPASHLLHLHTAGKGSERAGRPQAINAVLTCQQPVTRRCPCGRPRVQMADCANVLPGQLRCSGRKGGLNMICAKLQA